MLSASLMRNFFQFGYVTPDLDQAVALYRDRFGVREFLTFDTRAMQPDQPNYVRVGLAWIGATMVELIEPVGEHPLYACAMPESGFGIRLHHFGYRVPDEAAFMAALQDIDAAKIPTPVRGDPTSESPFAIVYADARDTLGHHVEIVLTKEGGRAMFDAVPHN